MLVTVMMMAFDDCGKSTVSCYAKTGYKIISREPTDLSTDSELVPV